MGKYFNPTYWFGLSGGVLCLLAFWAFYGMGLDPIDYTLFFACLIAPVFVFVGIKDFRDRRQDGELIFAQGMTIGFVIYALFGLIVALGVLLFLQLSPGIFEDYKMEKISWLEGQEEYMTENLGDETYQLTLTDTSMMSKGDVALDMFLKIFMLELFFTIIISIILKRTNN